MLPEREGKNPIDFNGSSSQSQRRWEAPSRASVLSPKRFSFHGLSDPFCLLLLFFLCKSFCFCFSWMVSEPEVGRLWKPCTVRGRSQAERGEERFSFTSCTVQSCQKVLWTETTLPTAGITGINNWQCLNTAINCSVDSEVRMGKCTLCVGWSAAFWDILTSWTWCFLLPKWTVPFWYKTVSEELRHLTAFHFVGHWKIFTGWSHQDLKRQDPKFPWSLFQVFRYLRHLWIPVLCCRGGYQAGRSAVLEGFCSHVAVETQFGILHYLVFSKAVALCPAVLCSGVVMGAAEAALQSAAPRDTPLYLTVTRTKVLLKKAAGNPGMRPTHEQKNQTAFLLFFQHSFSDQILFCPFIPFRCPFTWNYSRGEAQRWQLLGVLMFQEQQGTSWDSALYFPGVLCAGLFPRAACAQTQHSHHLKWFKFYFHAQCALTNPTYKIALHNVK